MKGEAEAFSVFEATAQGVLITEFLGSGPVIAQEYVGGADLAKAMEERIGKAETAGGYSKVMVGIQCECGSCSAFRQLDALEPLKIKEVPIVPVFACSGCSRRYYSMSDEYVAGLVRANPDLFSAAELESMAGDEQAFINELQEYISRFMASKKISRIR